MSLDLLVLGDCGFEVVAVGSPAFVGGALVEPPCLLVGPALPFVSEEEVPDLAPGDFILEAAA